MVAEQALTFGAARITPVVELTMPTSVRWLLPEHPDPGGLREAASAWLRPGFMNDRGHLLQTMQAFVLEVDGLTVVVDTGIGNDKERPGAAPDWHRRSGPFLDDFRAAGFNPDTVDFVICTHMHVDHVGWNTRLVEGEWAPTFGRARYIFAQAEYDYWKADAESDPPAGASAAGDSAPAGIPSHGAAFTDSVAPIVAAGLADLVDANSHAGHRLSASIRLTSSAGHTPGHVTVEVASGGPRALLVGDALHSPIQCAAPESRPALDTTKFAAAARERRRAILEDVAGTETVIAGSHFPPPGFGRVLRDSHSGGGDGSRGRDGGGAFRFQPIRRNA